MQVAEQLALEHALRQPPDVDGDHRSRGPRARGVQPPGGDLLANTVLAEEEHVGIGWRHPLHQPCGLSHGGRLVDEIRQPIAAERLVLAFQPLAPAQRATQLHLGAEYRDQPVVVPGLLEVVPRTPAHRLHGALDAAIGRHHDHGEVLSRATGSE